MTTDEIGRKLRAQDLHRGKDWATSSDAYSLDFSTTSIGAEREGSSIASAPGAASHQSEVEAEAQPVEN